MNKKKYKVIFFDWNKTLSDSLFWEQLSEKDHIHHEWHENISRYLFKENKDLVNQWMNGSVNENDIVEKISKEFKYPKETLSKYLAESCRTMKLVSDEVLPLIKKLKRKGTKCVIATDNTDTFKKYTVPGLKLDEYFDGYIVSFDRRWCKFQFDKDDTGVPFFDDYLRENKLKYSEVVLIDDSEDKSGTYKKLGLDIFKVSEPNDILDYLKRFAY